MSSDEKEDKIYGASNPTTVSWSAGESRSEGYSESASFRVRDRKAFSELIFLAEKVQAQRDALRRQLQMIIGGSGFIVVSTMAVISTVYDFSSPSFFLSTPAGVLGAFIIIAAYVGAMYAYMQMSRRLRRENRAFDEVMSVVHEVFEGLKGELSPLELAETRIRLSRLDN